MSALHIQCLAPPTLSVVLIHSVGPFFLLVLNNYFARLTSIFFNPSEVAEEQFADLHQVKGIRGVFIASQLLPNMTTSAGRRMHDLAPEHTLSFISFDQGAQWKPLQPPEKDASGEIIDCKRVRQKPPFVSMLKLLNLHSPAK